MGFYRRFSGVAASTIYRAFGSNADAEIAEIHSNDTTLSVTIYENVGMKTLIARDDGSLTLYEWDDKNKPIVLTTLVSANGKVTQTLEDRRTRFSVKRQFFRVPERPDRLIHEEIRDVAAAVLPLARYVVTSRHVRNPKRPPIDLDNIIAG